MRWFKLYHIELDHQVVALFWFMYTWRYGMHWYLGVFLYYYDEQYLAIGYSI